ncbi:tetratricopeptide repeat protein [Actinosynnema sp. NPDC050801]|uniref:tetratricopeptide repeat protein n=1 Tax=unclassified Actinosynnema TaxID=2637065 RepID=UPI0033C17EC6
MREPAAASPLAVLVPVSRRVELPGSAFAMPPPRGSLNILVVTARPDGPRDVGYRTVSRPLLEAVRRSELSVTVDLVRPGTWTALREHLRAASEEHGSGWYQLVHFDVHGTFTDYASLDSGRRAGRLLFASDKVAEFEGRRGFLSFETARDGEPVLVGASEVAALLAEHRVPMAVLNACQSAKQTASEAALAQQLVEAGVPTVVGMAYSVTVSAARAAMPVLYERLSRGVDPDLALRAMRRSLFDERARQAYFDQQVELEDWVLPVVFRQQPLALSLREMTPQEEERFLAREALVKEEPRPEYGFVGRDLDVQAVERRLLLDTNRNQLLLRGMAGAGKSTLITHLGWWWQRTGLVDRVFVFDYADRAWTAGQMIREIAKALLGRVDLARWEELSEQAATQRIVRMLRAARHLLVVDNAESITASPAAIPHALDTGQRDALRDLLSRLRGGRTLVVLGSRESETWLAPATFEANVYDLPGLDQQAASTLAERILARHHATHHHTDPDQRRALQRLLTLLGGYPLPLEVVLPTLADTDPTTVLAELDTGGTIADPVGLIRTAIEYSHGKLDPATQNALLLLAPFTTTVPTGPVLDRYHELLTEDPAATLAGPPDPQAGLRAAVTIGLAATAGGSDAQIVPVLPYFLRHRLREQPDLLAATQTAHYRLYAELGNMLGRMLVSPQPDDRTAARAAVHAWYANLTAALDHALRNVLPCMPLLEPLEEYLDQIRQNNTRRELLDTALNALTTADRNTVHAELAQLRHLAGIVAQEQRRFDDAENLYHQALELLLEFGNRHSAASTYHQLGMVAQEQRRFEDAGNLYHQALELLLEFGNRHSAALTYHQLGRVAQEQQRFEDAENLYHQALELLLEFGNRHSAASTYHQLGRVAQEQQRFEDAENLYHQALELKLEFGDRHSAASTYHQLGTVAQEQRRFEDADNLYRQALDLELEFGDRHGAASTYHQLGRVAQEQRRFEDADNLYRQALDLKLEFGNRHSAASTYHQLGTVAQEQQRLEDADNLYRQALDLELEFGDRHGAASTYHRLGRVGLEQRRFEDADNFYRQALELLLEFGDRHGAASTYHQLGRVAQEQQRLEDADNLYRQALAILTQSDPRSASIVATQLGKLLVEQNRYNDALDLVLEAAIGWYRFSGNLDTSDVDLIAVIRKAIGDEHFLTRVDSLVPEDLQDLITTTTVERPSE